MLVLGSTGMLGHVMTKVLRDGGIEVIEASRKGSIMKSQGVQIKFDVRQMRALEEIIAKEKFDYVINCVGIIKQLMDDKSNVSRSNAVLVNTEFPIYLNSLAESSNFRLIQIGTDCVFSGEKGSYSETDKHSPVDSYGSTKSLGEVIGINSLILRSSIIGPEISSRNSLLEWFLSSPKNSRVNGFTNHMWNGLTTLHFAKLVLGIIRSANFVGGLYHTIPQDRCSKNELLQSFRASFNRKDIAIDSVESPVFIDRTLVTNYPDFNCLIWKNSGYTEVPRISTMVHELSEWFFCESGKSGYAK